MIDTASDTMTNWPRWKWIASRCIVCCVGLVIAEILVRLLVPWPIYHSTWMTPGAHQPDAEFGFVFTPHFDGAMRNIDHVWMEPVRLNENGFRIAARSKTADRHPHVPASHVVVMGGASMAFSYGLPDKETLHHRLAAGLDFPAHVDVLSWPGFGLGQDYLKFQRYYDPETIDIAIVLAYGKHDYEQIDSDLPIVSSQSDPESSNVHWTHSLVVSKDPASQRIGSLYYKSRLLAGTARIVQRVCESFSLSKETPAIALEENPRLEIINPLAKQTRIRADVIATHICELGVKHVVIVALPQQGVRTGPRSIGSENVSAIPVLDLRDRYRSSETDWIAGGHYGRHSAALVAQPIADLLNKLEAASRADSEN